MLKNKKIKRILSWWRWRDKTRQGCSWCCRWMGQARDCMVYGGCHVIRAGLYKHDLSHSHWDTLLFV